MIFQDLFSVKKFFALFTPHKTNHADVPYCLLSHFLNFQKYISFTKMLSYTQSLIEIIKNYN